MGKYNFPVTWIPITDSEQKRIGISSCPGKLSPQLGSNERLVADLESLNRQNIDCIVTLATEHEIKRMGIRHFNDNVKRYSFKHFIEPIEDLSVPKITQISNIQDLLDKIINEFYDNKRILVHCNAGLGRSGTIVALLVKLMAGVHDPIAYLRKYRLGAIETIEQELFVSKF